MAQGSEDRSPTHFQLGWGDFLRAMDFSDLLEGAPINLDELITGITPYELTFLFEDLDTAFSLLASVFKEKHSDALLQLAARHLVLWRGRNSSRIGANTSYNLARSVRPRLEAIASESIQDAFEEQKSCSVELVRTVSKSHFKAALKRPDVSRTELELLEKERWASALVSFIQEANLPLCKIAESTTSPAQVLVKAVGSRRAKTLRNRVRAWQKVRDWLLFARGYPYPKSISDMLDFLLFLEEDGLKKSYISQVSAALAVIEDVGMVEPDHRISTHRTWVQVCQSLQADADASSAPRRSAPPLTVAMLLSLELTVVDSETPEYHRALVWIILICIWACLRLSDLEGIDPRRATMSSAGFKGIVSKTKTTGPGKRVLEVPIFVHRRAGISGVDWLTTGWGIWEQYNASHPRDYFLMRPSDDFCFPLKKFMNTMQMAGFVKRAFRELRPPTKNRFTDSWKLVEHAELVPIEAIMFWSGHSLRHFLPTVAAAMHYNKEQRDYLGRWQAGSQQSNDYIHSARQNVHDIQVGVSQGLMDGSKSYDETELLQNLEAWVSEKSGDPREVRRHHTVLRMIHGSWQLGSRWQDDAEFRKYDYWSLRSEEKDAGVIHLEHAESLAEAKYFVVVSRRSGFRRLHKLNSCGIDWRSCSRVEFVSSITKSTADAVCRRCAQISNLKETSEAESSSSGSSSSTSIEENDQNLE